MTLFCIFYGFIFYKFYITKTYFIGNAYFGGGFFPEFSVACLCPVTGVKKAFLKLGIV